MLVLQPLNNILRMCMLLLLCLWILPIIPVFAASNIDYRQNMDESDEARLAEDAPGMRFDPVMFRLSTGLTQYKEIFVNPVTWSEEFKNNDMEIIYQLSAKVRLFDMNLYFGYTQKSFWQAFNSSNSSPFRDTDYNPEIFYRIPPGLYPLQKMGIDAGIEHESNGQSLPFSRSWNRAYIRPYLTRSNDLFYIKLWYRIPEDEKTSVLDPTGDDNPDIQHYYGYSELNYVYLSNGMQRFHIMMRGNPETGKGAVRLSYEMPSGSKDMYYRISLWSGYGESLSNYNQSITRLAIGVSFYR